MGFFEDERRGQVGLEYVLMAQPLDGTNDEPSQVNGLQTTPRARRPRPKVVTLTPRAGDRVREILANSQSAYIGLRIGIKNGGCAGQEYTFAYADTVEPMDEVVQDQGVTVLIDPKAVLFLIGTEIDFETSRLSSKFVFRNPNQTDACGCGESVTIVPAKAPTV